jgi:hypothetical protein
MGGVAVLSLSVLNSSVEPGEPRNVTEAEVLARIDQDEEVFLLFFGKQEKEK